jgi:hypothetical protein
MRLSAGFMIPNTLLAADVGELVAPRKGHYMKRVRPGPGRGEYRASLEH